MIVEDNYQAIHFFSVTVSWACAEAGQEADANNSVNIGVEVSSLTSRHG